jgi:hypothetical protein
MPGRKIEYFDVDSLEQMPGALSGPGGVEGWSRWTTEAMAADIGEPNRVMERSLAPAIWAPIQRLGNGARGN